MASLLRSIILGTPLTQKRGTQPSVDGCRVYLVSDLHTDHYTNLEIIKSWNVHKIGNESNILIIAGDISSKLSLIRETFEIVKNKFDSIIYVPGNNEVPLSFHKFSSPKLILFYC